MLPTAKPCSPRMRESQRQYYFSWRAKLSRSLCLHSYFISNSNIFYKGDIISSLWHPWWWELDVLTCQWQVNCWRADRRHQRHVSRLLHPFPSPDYLSARFAHQFFFLFPPMCIAWSQAYWGQSNHYIVALDHKLFKMSVEMAWPWKKKGKSPYFMLVAWNSHPAVRSFYPTHPHSSSPLVLHFTGI